MVQACLGKHTLSGKVEEGPGVSGSHLATLEG
jgi:hypothetical protein